MTENMTAQWSQGIVRRTNAWVSGKSADETLMMRIDTGEYLALNDTATVLWDALESPCSLEQLCERLTVGFPVEPEQARGDIIRLLDELEEEGAVTLDVAKTA